MFMEVKGNRHMVDTLIPKEFGLLVVQCICCRMTGG